MPEFPLHVFAVFTHAEEDEHLELVNSFEDALITAVWQADRPGLDYIEVRDEDNVVWYEMYPTLNKQYVFVLEYDEFGQEGDISKHYI